MTEKPTPLVRATQFINTGVLVGYMPSGEAIKLLEDKVICAPENDQGIVTEWEIIHTWFRYGYYDESNYGHRRDDQAVYTLCREAVQGEALPGLSHAYAVLRVLNEVVSFTLQGHGTFNLLEKPPVAEQIA